jgi:alkyldihydroxyacetonephosphate synthase
LQRALELCADYSGEHSAEANNQEGAHRSGAAGQWRERFLRMPLFREELTARGIIADTCETAVAWEQLPGAQVGEKRA